MVRKKLYIQEWIIEWEKIPSSYEYSDEVKNLSRKESENLYNKGQTYGNMKTKRVNWTQEKKGNTEDRWKERYKRE